MKGKRSRKPNRPHPASPACLKGYALDTGISHLFSHPWGKEVGVGGTQLGRRIPRYPLLSPPGGGLRGTKRLAALPFCSCPQGQAHGTDQGPAPSQWDSKSVSLRSDVLGGQGQRVLLCSNGPGPQMGPHAGEFSLKESLRVLSL